MEPEKPPAETSDDPKPPSTSINPQQQQSTTQTLRSYECNFCKRGFTNAQALGGHMNIHRKNKTKFKHSSSTTATPPNPPVEPPSATTANPFSISHQRNWFSSTPQDEKKPLLPLFDHHETAVAVQRDIHEPENSPLPDEDVDLELRLGHVEPPQESSSEIKTTTTRKFF